MRLLDTRTYELSDFAENKIPLYGIVSHRWEDQEVSFQDYRKKRHCHGPGYDKIINALCIDKRPSSELSEAINSMYHWYEDAIECYAYLSDVRPTLHDKRLDLEAFASSAWFLRGWTLQELIAPQHVVFCASDWGVIGVKEDDKRFAYHFDLESLRTPYGRLEALIAGITGTR